MPERAGFRAIRAALYAIAAEVEVMSPATERWRVRVEFNSDLHGRVYIELSTGSSDEETRAMQGLRLVAG